MKVAKLIEPEVIEVFEEEMDQTLNGSEVLIDIKADGVLMKIYREPQYC